MRRPVVAAVHLVLPYAFRLRPVLVARRAAVFAVLWAGTSGSTPSVPGLKTDLDAELGGGRLRVVHRRLGVGRYGGDRGVRGERLPSARRLRPVAAAEQPVLRELLDAAGQ